MIQVDLFQQSVSRAHTPPPSARASDPETSHAAAISARELAQHHIDIILAALKRHGPSGKDRIAALTRLTGVQVCRRLTEMHRGGLIAETGKMVLSTAARKEREWRAA